MVTTVKLSELTATWNDAGADHDGVKMTVLNTDSGAGSNLMHLLASTGGFFRFDKSGNLVLSGTVDGRDVAADGTLVDSAMQEVADDSSPALSATLDASDKQIINVQLLSLKYSSPLIVGAPNIGNLWITATGALTYRDQDDVSYDLTAGAFTADADTQITPTTPIVLDQATGNEWGLSLNYTVNKATSGDDTGFLINKTDTASPGASLLQDWQVGGVSKTNIDDNGRLVLDADQSYGSGTGISFGSGQSALYETSNGLLRMQVGGVQQWKFLAASMIGLAAKSAQLSAAASSATSPCHTLVGDTNTGVGSAGPDMLSHIAGGVEGLRLQEDSGGVLHVVQVGSGLTAFAGGGQASALLLTSSFNQISTVATAGDSIRLPTTVGSKVTIINNGANALDIFPSTGGYIGQEAINVAIPLGINTTVTLLLYDATHWEKI